MSNILTRLQAYLEDASQEQILSDWEELKDWNEIGPLASEYIEMCQSGYQKQTILVSINKNPEYALDFLFNPYAPYGYQAC